MANFKISELPAGTQPITGDELVPVVQDGITVYVPASALKGQAGADGREVELQKSATHVQWRYVGDSTWIDLVALSEITGPPGTGGAPQWDDIEGKPETFPAGGGAGGVLSGSFPNPGFAVDMATQGELDTQLTLVYTALDDLDAAKVNATEKGAANGVATLGADSKIPAAQLPAIAITDTFPVASQAAMLALTAEKGDIAVRSDLNKTFALSAEPASTLANWLELKTPTDAVLSVAGRTGAVTLTSADVGLGNVNNTADSAKPVSTAQQAAIDATATATATLTNKTLTTPILNEYLEFNEATSLPATPGADKVRMYIRDVNGLSALEAITSTGTRFRFLRDQLYFARNESGVTIPKGSPVYISGVFTGGDIVPVVSLARANAAGTMPCDGIAGTDILNNGYGRVYTDGRIEDVNTSAFATGDRLFVSSATAGALVTTPPAHPNLPQQVARVTRSHASTGSLQVTLRGQGGESKGTNQNTFSVGDAAAGAKVLAFSANSVGNLSWTPTAARTLTLPDATATLIGRDTTDTLTNKRINPRVTSETSSATPTINTDNTDLHRITALAVNVTSFTTNLTGTPVHGQGLLVEITGTAARTLAWGASFEASTVPLPTTTVTTAMLTVAFTWNSATSKWRCIGVA